MLPTLDRSGVLWRPAAATIGSGGGVTPTFTRVGTFYFKRETPSARTIIAGARDAEQVEDVIVMRWFDTFGPGWRLVMENQTYRVVRADEIGRREGWRVYCRLDTPN